MGFDEEWDSASASTSDSNSSSNSFDAQWEAAPTPSFIDNVWGDIKAIPSQITALPSAIAGGASNIYNDLFHPVDSLNNGTLERTVRGAGGLAAGVAGAEAGGSAGAVLGPWGVVGGGALGFGAGMLGFDVLNEATGADQPTTPEEKLAKLRANTVQGAVLGGAGKIAGDVAGAVASKVANKVSDIAPTNPLEVKAVVGDTLGQFTSAQDLTDALKGIKNDSLAAQRTTAELTQSPEIAILEQQLGSGTNALDYAKYQNEIRPANTQFILDNISPAKGVAEETTGATARDLFAKQKAADKALVTKAYEAIPEGVKANVYPLKAKLQDLKSQYFGPGAGEMPAELKSRFDYITNAKNQNRLSIQELKNVRSRVLSVGRSFADQTGPDAAMAYKMADAIQQTLANAPEGAADWKLANQLAAEYYAKYKGKGEIKTPLANITKLQNSQIYNKILSSPEAAAQFKNVVGDAGVTAIKDQIASELSGLSEIKKANFIDAHESQLKSLLGNDFSLLDNIRSDIKSRIGTQKLANATRGSNTALKLSDVVQRAISGKDVIRESLGGTLWNRLRDSALGANIAMHPITGSAIAAAAYGVGALKQASQAAIREELFQSLLNPSRALENIKIAEKGVVPKVITVSPKLASTSAAAMLGSQQTGQPNLKTNVISDLFTNSKSMLDNKSTQDQIKAKIASDPFDAAVFETESSSGKKLTNPNSSAKGGFQLINATANKLGVKDPMDLKQNYEGFLKLKAENAARFGNNPEVLYAAHFLGATTLDKVIKNEPLTATQQKHVDEFKSLALPRFRKIYAQITDKRLKA